jgi:hypothetical protein
MERYEREIMKKEMKLNIAIHITNEEFGDLSDLY